jgi:hypothetical protein
MKPVVTAGITVLLTCVFSACADCPLDHLIIGCNRDGIAGTEDDNTLFVDCGQKYRDSGETSYAHWFYPLSRSVLPDYAYRIGEPGFDAFQARDPDDDHTYDPNRSLHGDPGVDYRLVVECLSLSPGLRAVHKDYPQFTVEAVGRTFDHSYLQVLLGDSHLHMSYQATDGQTLQWFTFGVRDTLADGDSYEPSEPCTLVFNAEPLAGDLAVDGTVNVTDLARMGRYWLAPESGRHNDYCERADTNRDGAVDFFDFARLASNWRAQRR